MGLLVSIMATVNNLDVFFRSHLFYFILIIHDYLYILDIGLRTTPSRGDEYYSDIDLIR